jgi:hypothetical protein
MGRACSTDGEKRNAYMTLGPLGRPRRRWVDNIEMDLRETGWDGMDWIDLAQDRDQWKALVNAVMKLWVPLGISTVAAQLAGSQEGLHE